MRSLPPPTAFLATVSLAVGMARADTHALLVGIARYSAARPPAGLQHRPPDLPAAENDVELTRQLLNRLAGRQCHFTVLLNGQATYDNVLLALSKLEKNTRPEDSVVLYLTMHGAAIYEGGRLKARALLLWDQELPGKALRDRFSRLPARDKTLIVDSCFAAATDKGLPPEDRPIAKSVAVHRQPTEAPPDTEFWEALAAPLAGARGFGGDRPYTVLAACRRTVPAYAAPFAGSGAPRRWHSAFTLALHQTLFIRPVVAEGLEAALRQAVTSLLGGAEVVQRPVVLGKRPSPGDLFGGGKRLPLRAARVPNTGRWSLPVGLAADVGPGSCFRVVGKKTRFEVRSAEWFTCEADIERGAVSGRACDVLFLGPKLPRLRAVRTEPKCVEILSALPRDRDALFVGWERDSYTLGEPMHFTVQPKRAGWLSLLLTDGGNLLLLLPNAQRPALRVGTHEIVTDETLGVPLTAQPPVGGEQMIAVLTDAPPRWPVALRTPVTPLTAVSLPEVGAALPGVVRADALVEVVASGGR